MICPKCDGEIDALIVDSWGKNPEQASKQRLQPYVCSWCASLLVVDFGAGKLLEPAGLLYSHGVDAIAAMRSNQELWRMLTSIQAYIEAMPNRRPVLR